MHSQSHALVPGLAALRRLVPPQAIRLRPSVMETIKIDTRGCYLLKPSAIFDHKDAVSLYLFCPHSERERQHFATNPQTEGGDFALHLHSCHVYESLEIWKREPKVLPTTLAWCEILAILKDEDLSLIESLATCRTILKDDPLCVVAFPSAIYSPFWRLMRIRQAARAVDKKNAAVLASSLAFALSFTHPFIHVKCFKPFCLFWYRNS